MLDEAVILTTVYALVDFSIFVQKRLFQESLNLKLYTTAPYNMFALSTFLKR